MRTTITVDDELYRQALDVADPGMRKSDLFREAKRVFVHVPGKRPAALGGKSPPMNPIPRRRPA